MSNLKWIGWAGGPMLLVAKQLLPFWNRDDEGTDYLRLIDTMTQDYIQRVQIGKGQGIIIVPESEPYGTWIGEPNSTSGVAVCAEAIDDGADVPGLLTQAENSVWHSTEWVLPVPSGNLVLLPAACSQRDKHLDIKVAPGDYGIDWHHLDVPTASLVLCRLDRVPR